MPSSLAPQHARCLILLLLLVGALYAPGLAGPFFFDDGPALTGNPFLRIGGEQFDDWRTASFSSRSGPRCASRAASSHARTSGGGRAVSRRKSCFCAGRATPNIGIVVFR